VSFKWVAKAARFRDNKTGRFVAKATIQKWSGQSIDAMPSLAAEFAKGATVGEWQTAMRENIKREYIRQYLEGRGGRARMTQVDWGSIGGSVADQYRYLDGFASEIADGKLSDKQIEARSKMYFNSAREARERAAKRAAEEAALDEAQWVYDPRAEHCRDCVGLAALGWQKVKPWPFKVGGRNVYPGSGGTICLTS